MKNPLFRLKPFLTTKKGKVVTVCTGTVLVGVIVTAVCLMSGASKPKAAAVSNTSSAVSSVSIPAITSSAPASSSSSPEVSKPAEVAVTSITLDKTDITLNIGEQTALAYAIKPDNATNISVSWDTSDKSVATIRAKDCIVTGVSAGTATITVTASNGMNATCNVTVKGKSSSAKKSKGEQEQSGSGSGSGNDAAAPAPAASYSASNAAGIADYAQYGFKNGVEANNATVLTERWDFDKMVSDVTDGIQLGDTVDCNSTDLNNYKSQMYYYSASESSIDGWIDEISKYHVVESCEFNTSTNDIYQNANGDMIVRGKKVMHVTSADAGYYSELGLSGPGTYYRIIDVIVATGAQSNRHSQSMYAIGGAYNLTRWTRA